MTAVPPTEGIFKQAKHLQLHITTTVSCCSWRDGMLWRRGFKARCKLQFSESEILVHV